MYGNDSISIWRFSNNGASSLHSASWYDRLIQDSRKTVLSSGPTSDSLHIISHKIRLRKQGWRHTPNESLHEMNSASNHLMFFGWVGRCECKKGSRLIKDRLTCATYKTVTVPLLLHTCGVLRRGRRPKDVNLSNTYVTRVAKDQNNICTMLGN